jgi:predicted transcriptional regulator
MTFMLQRQQDRNRAPTVREIATHINKSVGTTHYHLSCMKEMGIVTMKSPRRMWAAEVRRPYYAEED